MSRYYIDCRDMPDEKHCSVAIAANSKEELLEAAIQHGTAVHGYKDTPDFRKEIVGAFKEGTPPVEH